MSQWANDLLMWENKVFVERPLLVKGDGPVTKLRRWYSQFYGGGAPKVCVGEAEAPEAVCVAKGAKDW